MNVGVFPYDYSIRNPLGMALKELGRVMNSETSTDGKNKVKIVGISVVAIALLWFIVPAVFHSIGYLAHNLNKPDPTMCIAGHDEESLQPIMVGKVVSLIPETEYVCDREGANPNYASELAKWIGSK